MNESDRRAVALQLAHVIAWEMEAQVGINRPVEQMPELIADSVLDFFDVILKPGVDLHLPSKNDRK